MVGPGIDQGERGWDKETRPDSLNQTEKDEQEGGGNGHDEQPGYQGEEEPSPDQGDLTDAVGKESCRQHQQKCTEEVG